MEIGNLYFFTCTILNWEQALRHASCKQIIIDSLNYLVENKQAQVAAFVIMPNHIHLIWQPIGDNVQLRFMKFTAQQIKFYLQQHDLALLSQLRVDKTDRQYQIWQRSPLAIELYSREVVEQKLDYIHFNPSHEKWSLVTDPIDYAYSSVRFYESPESNPYPFLTHYMDILGI
jgi:putative transposase